MRKIVLLIITSVILVFWGCSSDKIESFDSGQYLFQNDTLTVAIYFENDGSGQIHAFVNNTIIYQNLQGVRYTGKYPHYSLTVRDIADNWETVLQLNCTFCSASVFSANVVSSKLDNIFWRYGYRRINLPGTMQFKSDDRTLDSNGDGILDWAQIL